MVKDWCREVRDNGVAVNRVTTYVTCPAVTLVDSPARYKLPFCTALQCASPRCLSCFFASLRAEGCWLTGAVANELLSAPCASPGAPQPPSLLSCCRQLELTLSSTSACLSSFTSQLLRLCEPGVLFSRAIFSVLGVIGARVRTKPRRAFRDGGFSSALGACDRVLLLPSPVVQPAVVVAVLLFVALLVLAHAVCVEGPLAFGSAALFPPGVQHGRPTVRTRARAGRLYTAYG